MAIGVGKIKINHRILVVFKCIKSLEPIMCMAHEKGSTENQPILVIHFRTCGEISAT